MADHVQSTKEIVRHFLFTVGGSGALRLLKRVRKLPASHLDHEGLEDRFTAIYRDRVWSANGSVSGPGSYAEAKAELQAELGRVLEELSATEVVDIGCGDFGWMSGVEGNFRYCGLDIVAGLIAELNARFGNERRRFLHLDGTKDALPSGDVAICREILFHLSFSDAKALIENLIRHGFTYLIATCDGVVWFNSDIPSGDYRPINLTAPPFGFTSPIRTIRDDSVVPGRFLGVWRLASIA